MSGAVGRVGTSTEISYICPLPVQLRDVRFRYPGAETDSLRGMDLRLEGRQFVVVVGANGSGKSTLVRILAGAAVTAGTADRVGAVGLGQIGGTALVMQRPETQVLGMKVSDDLVWGLPPGFTTGLGGGSGKRWAWPDWRIGQLIRSPEGSCSGWQWPQPWCGAHLC